MSLRQKLLLLLSLTVAAAVASVAWTVLVRIRHVFDQRDQEETALFVAQFQREFQNQSAGVTDTLSRLAETDRARFVATEVTQSGDLAPYLNEARTMADAAHLDFLEMVGPTGDVISSAQWPARFGYPEPAAMSPKAASFLKREDLPDGTSALGLFFVTAIDGVNPPVWLIGGKKLDQGFLADLPVAPGMTVALYSDAPSTPVTNTAASNTSSSAPPPSAFDPPRLIGVDGVVPNAARYENLVLTALRNGQQSSSILYLTKRREDSISVTALPLKDESGKVLAVLTVAISRSSMVEAQQHIRAIAYGVASTGILLAIVFSLWIAARVSRPIEELARASEAVAAGNWEVSVPERGRDDLALLARSFNHMTAQLVSQRERLVQTERVAAWRELARRLAHELKNPLFPLQLTVENLARSRQLPQAEFDEVFEESTKTLGMEIANLKTIIGRFSDFSKMPRPQLEALDAAAAVERIRALYESACPPNVRLLTDVATEPMPLDADPEMLHRALSNLVLNAMDAMPDGGTVTVSARPVEDTIEIRVADTGAGLTPEECERLFTPYYTTKQHGTGLGLAIVQSVIADHAGTIAVDSRAGGGATFIISLPKASV
ncbi:MAG TPA: ATP-binding protein [Terracidiphilus sp.]|nr:ATP-binding protein [Terracidiphilus sp.]